MPVAERFVDTVQGRIHCAESGSGEPLLLLHSNGCSLHEFSKVIGPLGAHFRCIAWDMPGHGDSDRPLGHMSISAYARAVVALMDAMDIQAAHVCGASVGGFICAAIGRIAPERVLSLLVVEAALRSEAAWAGQWPRIEAAFAIPRQTREQVAPRFRAVDDGALARWNIDREKAGGYRMVDVMWAIREFDTEPCLTGLTVPVSVIIGDRGPVADCRERYRGLMPAAEIRDIHNAGHFPMIDDPVAFVDAVRELIGIMNDTPRRTPAHQQE